MAIRYRPNVRAGLPQIKNDQELFGWPFLFDLCCTNYRLYSKRWVNVFLCGLNNQGLRLHFEFLSDATTIHGPAPLSVNSIPSAFRRWL
jgi:hypothetical protein